MILLPIELIAAIFAWRKGWRWRALIPIAFGYALSIGVAILFVTLVNPTSNTVRAAGYFGFAIHAVVVMALGVLAMTPRPAAAAPSWNPGGPSANSPLW